MMSVPKRAGRGTHGSLTKAGRVRDQVRQDRGVTDTIKYWKEKRDRSRKTSPRRENRRKYVNRIKSGKLKLHPMAPSIHIRKGRMNVKRD